MIKVSFAHIKRLQEETAKVEEHLLDGSFTKGIIRCFTTSKTNAFENLLEPLQKLLRLSPPVALTLANPDLFCRILQKLQSSKAVVRLNLLRIVRSICDASEEQGGLIVRFGLIDTIQRLAEVDGAVLVRNMASELVRSGEIDDKSIVSGVKRRLGRHSSSTTTFPSLLTSQSMPPTPTTNRSAHSVNHFRERPPVQSSIGNQPTAFRYTSRGDTGPSDISSLHDTSGAVTKSRLPRTTNGRHSFMQSPKKEENITPLTSSRETTPTSAPNTRRRRLLSSDMR